MKLKNPFKAAKKRASRNQQTSLRFIFLKKKKIIIEICNDSLRATDTKYIFSFFRFLESIFSKSYINLVTLITRSIWLP